MDERRERWAAKARARAAAEAQAAQRNAAERQRKGLEFLLGSWQP